MNRIIMRTLEQIEQNLKQNQTLYKHHAHLGQLVDELLEIARRYRSDAKHDRNCIRAIQQESRRVFSFPRSEFVDKNGRFLQLMHIKSEMLELEEAYFNESDIRVAEEALDLKHSAETLLRILEERHSIDIETLREHIIKKNKSRGYYAPSL